MEKPMDNGWEAEEVSEVAMNLFGENQSLRGIWWRFTQSREAWREWVGVDWSGIGPKWDGVPEKAHSVQEEVARHAAAVHPCHQGDPMQAEGRDLVATKYS